MIQAPAQGVRSGSWLHFILPPFSFPFDASPLLLPPTKVPPRQERINCSKRGQRERAVETTQESKQTPHAPWSPLDLCFPAPASALPSPAPSPAAALAYQTARPSGPSSRPGTSHSPARRPITFLPAGTTLFRRRTRGAGPLGPRSLVFLPRSDRVRWFFQQRCASVLIGVLQLGPQQFSMCVAVVPCCVRSRMRCRESSRSSHFLLSSGLPRAMLFRSQPCCSGRKSH